MTITETGTSFAPTPEDYPGADALVERARSLIPRIRELQQDTEDLTAFPEELRQKFIENDLYRLYVPKRYGGFEETPATSCASSWRFLAAT